MMLYRWTSIFGMVLLLLTITACGGTDDEGGDSGDDSSASSGDTGDTGNGDDSAGTTKTAAQKVVGTWQAVISFDNEKYDAFREGLPSDEAREGLDAMVDGMIGTIIDMEFKEDGTAWSTDPMDRESKADGTWEIADDQNSTATLTMNWQTGEDEPTVVVSNITFSDDDNFKAPFEPEPGAGDFWYLDVVRVGSSDE